jgi:hypothetical protein
MKIFVLITDQVREDCQLHGMGTACLDDFAKRIEDSQHLEFFERNNPHPVLVKKQFRGRDKRLVAAQRHIGEDSVVVLLRVLIRGNAEYTDHFEGRVLPEVTLGYIQSQLNLSAPSETLEKFVAERNTKNPPTPLPSISSVEHDFLWSQAYPKSDDDTLVCETHEFVKDLSQTTIKNQLIRIPDLILAAISGPASEVSIISDQASKGLRLLAYNSPQTHQCVILQVFQDMQAEAELAKTEWSQRLAGADAKTLLRFCRVSYPSLICGDDQTWVRMHASDDGVDSIANLSLSPEEGDILASCDRVEGTNIGFPLFINGRAGSGKSTLLQYLFAYCFRRWLMTVGLDEKYSSRPLYLASSGTLLEVAHDASVSILALNSKQVLDGFSLDGGAKAALQACFRQTGNFMHSLLTPEQALRFPLNLRVDYARFRKLWLIQFRNERRAFREYGPQLSWHVIRGLIKGFSSVELLDRDEYESLPRNERAVSSETFKKVYSLVWENWYRRMCSEQGLWDDQDIARLLIENNQMPRTHIAVFCDEAQDFTRVELDAIYQCSLFSNRALDAHCISRVPFVFAGDPFQTLNPTGFRWESVQAAFTERLVSSLHRFCSYGKLPDLHYEELTFNYRSAKRIVHFCNTIQASRALLFGHTDLRPQETWRIQDDQNAPSFLDIADQQIKQSLKDQKDLVLIVPCEEGEEQEYVESDQFLCDIVDRDDLGVPLNVVSAARSKGLEYKRVGLYGWSLRDEARRIAELLKCSDVLSIDADEKLQLEYFMNNLYVAASRAQRRLFIIDKEESRHGLWWIVDDEEHLQKLNSTLPPEWAQHIGSMVSGGADSFQHDQDTNRRRAEQQKTEGLAKRSSFTLRQAARYFELDRNDFEANRCRGFAHRFGEKHIESARHFEAAGEIREAVLSLWQGDLFEEINKLCTKHPSEANSPECVLSTFLSEDNNSPSECIELLNRIVEAVCADSGYKRRLTETAWSVGIERALNRLLEKSCTELDSINTNLLVGSLKELTNLGLVITVDCKCKLYLKAGYFDEVITILGKDSSSVLYRDAVALRALANVARGNAISQEQSAAVGDYLLRQQNPRYLEAADFFFRADNIAQLRLCFESACETETTIDDLITIAELLVRAYLHHRDWTSLVVTLDAGDLVSHSKNAKESCSRSPHLRKQLLQAFAKRNTFYEYVVPALAVSAELSNDSSQATHNVQRLLKARVSDQEWRKYVSPRVMGAAIERAGKDIDALEFYEKLMEDGSSGSEKQFARIRWAVCKLRQAKRQSSKKNELEAQRFCEKYGISGEDLGADYPDVSHELSGEHKAEYAKDRVPEPSAIPFLPDRERVVAGKLEYNYVRERQWVNIESSDGLQARVRIDGQSVESQDTEVIRLANGAFVCRELELKVEWLDDKHALLIHRELAWIARGNT